MLSFAGRGQGHRWLPDVVPGASRSHRCCWPRVGCGIGGSAMLLRGARADGGAAGRQGRRWGGGAPGQTVGRRGRQGRRWGGGAAGRTVGRRGTGQTVGRRGRRADGGAVGAITEAGPDLAGSGPASWRAIVSFPTGACRLHRLGCCQRSQRVRQAGYRALLLASERR